MPICSGVSRAGLGRHDDFLVQTGDVADQGAVGAFAGHNGHAQVAPLEGGRFLIQAKIAALFLGPWQE